LICLKSFDRQSLYSVHRIQRPGRLQQLQTTHASLLLTTVHPPRALPLPTTPLPTPSPSFASSMILTRPTPFRSKNSRRSKNRSKIIAYNQIDLFNIPGLRGIKHAHHASPRFIRMSVQDPPSSSPKCSRAIPGYQ